MFNEECNENSVFPNRSRLRNVSDSFDSDAMLSTEQKFHKNQPYIWLNYPASIRSYSVSQQKMFLIGFQKSLYIQNLEHST